MTTIHVAQWVAAFLAATALTGGWLLRRPRSRWRHLIAGLAATLAWIPVAYTANNVGVADGGEVVTFGSDALVTLSIFMAIASIAGVLIGLVLWVEEATDDASEELPSDMRPGRGGSR